MADAHYPVDPSRAKTELHWEPRRSLRHTLPAILDRLKQNPRRWYAENNLTIPKAMAART